MKTIIKNWCDKIKSFARSTGKRIKKWCDRWCDKIKSRTRPAGERIYDFICKQCYRARMLYARIKCIVVCVLYSLSITYVFAKFAKNYREKTAVIKNLNSFYLSVAIIGVVFASIFQPLFSNLSNVHWTICILIAIPHCMWMYLLFSRCNEIFFAFLKDAVDKLSLSDKNPSSNLTNKDRVILALKSYLELIINFALIYLLFPGKSCSLWKGTPPADIWDTLYFSGVTITTLGYGDYSPSNAFLKLVTVYEVFCGFTLLIVSFTIYTRKDGEKGKSKAN